MAKINFDQNEIERFCHKWKLSEFALFGSVLREDFTPESDVDVLISFAPGESMTIEAFLEMRKELSNIFGGRSVDLVEKQLLTNPYRRHDILTTRKTLYAA
jgi:predicted nucleotidyltransferase